jgi:outer membrane protein TolC
MMTRPFIIAALGSLLVSAPATAERRRATRDDDSRRAIGKVAKPDRSDRTNEESDADVDEDRPARSRKADRKSAGRKSAARDEERAPKKRERRERVADIEAADDDGPEAQAVLPVKLDELIDVAVRLSPELARAKAERAIAKGGAGAARKEQSWILGADASYAINAVSREVAVSPLAPVRQNDTKASLSLGRKLPTGGAVSVELGMTRGTGEIAIPQEYLDAINGTASQAPGQTPGEVPEEHFERDQAYAKLTLVQPLARGFGPDVALAAEKRADLQLSEATIRTQLAAEEMIFNIVSGYWELAYLNEAVDVRNKALKFAEAQEKVTRALMREGNQPQNAINAITYEIATRKESLLAAQLEFEKKSLEMRKKLGLELSRRQIALRPAEALEIGADEWDIDDVLALSRKANRRLLALGIQRKIADVDVKVAKNAMLPQIDFTVSGGLVGSGNSPDAAFSGIGAANGYQFMAGLKVEFELSGAARSAHEAAVAKKGRIEVDRADLARTLDVEVVAAVKAVTAARTRVGLSDTAIYVAEENLKAEAAAFSSGRSDNFRIMERQTQLIEAQLRRARAVVEYHTAVAQLQQLGGFLLEQYKVNVRPGR